jgi:SOS-response transcriptional repressor LexA
MTEVVTIPTPADSSLQEVPYFSDLRIACGHFRTSQHEGENIAYQALPLSYGTLDPARHFIARASGNSMDGGRNPIQSGDYLLLELITPDNAGSNDGRTIAIERQDVTGDDQYLLRTVKKLGDNQYQLIAQNPDYEPMLATEEMNTFARLRQVIDPVDIHLHQSFMREEIPVLFNLEFNTGLWQSGHVCPKNHPDQFLLVTLNKQGKIKDHQYHDYFIDQENFHWQSQNSATPNSAKGTAIINHTSNNSRVHLFVRKNKLEANKGAPFYYCGDLKYLRHKDEKPMNVEWLLERPLSKELFEYFSG